MDTLFSMGGLKSALSRLVGSAEADAQKAEKEIDAATKKDVSLNVECDNLYVHMSHRRRKRKNQLQKKNNQRMSLQKQQLLLQNPSSPLRQK